MAEVLSPFSQSTTSVTMLHSGDGYQNSSQNQQRQQPRQQQQQLSRVNLFNSNNGVLGYRSTSSGPVAPYAFQSTPQLRPEIRTSSSHSGTVSNTQGKRNGPLASSSASIASSNSSSARSKDDSVISSRQQYQLPMFDSRLKSPLSFSPSTPDLTLPSFDQPTKPSPDRYRRGQRRSEFQPSATNVAQEATSPARQAAPSGSGMANVAHLYQDPRSTTRPSHVRAGSVDDMSLPRVASDQAKRYRRRSMSGFEFSAPDLSGGPAPFTAELPGPPRHDAPASGLARPRPQHDRNDSAGSSSSTATANRPSSRREQGSPSQRPASPKASSPRGAADASRRLASPSPLSQSTGDSRPKQPSGLRPAVIGGNSPAPGGPVTAAQHLQAVTEKDLGKSKKSRLRRAFSFGSAAELRRVTVENNHDRSKLQKHRSPEEEQEAEHEAIAAQQEAAGIGASIYSGQGGFTGSTDNISISSTASSASIMLRKMGKGMKKGGRSIKGLFRPKSVVGVAPADAPVSGSVAQVSMVTVEAEREKVNVNLDPHDQVGGGTNYPKLERNSMEAVGAEMASSNGTGAAQDAWARKSIVGGDRERQDVLAAVKKGILKRHLTDVNTPTRVADRAPELAMPSGLHSTDSPRSSAPSTPNDDQRAVLPVSLGEDYFLAARFAGSTKSLPTAPQANRNISFSPRIQFHDAWSSTEYDRRGDIATCNRLTPMLAQQIKEELNTFKMEMEVHELSKPHTHFF